MSFNINKKLQKKLNKLNKIIDKGITGTNKTKYDYDKDMVHYYFEGRDAVIGGYYSYNKKGSVSDWSVVDWTRYNKTQTDPLYRYTFQVDGKKNFKKNVQHIGQAMQSKEYLSLLTDMATSGNGRAMASYLDQLDGIKDGDYSTSVLTWASDKFFFA